MRAGAAKNLRRSRIQSSLGWLGNHDWRRHHIVDHDRPHTGEVKTPQEWIRSKLSRTQQVDNKLHQQRTKFLQLSWKLINPWQLVAIVLSWKQQDATLGERIEDLVECLGQPLCFLIGIDPRAQRPHGKSRTQHFRGLILTHLADKFGEERNAVQLGEENVDRKADSENLRYLLQPC